MGQERREAEEAGDMLLKRQRRQETYALKIGRRGRSGRMPDICS
jgi:hypothetical protein